MVELAILSLFNRYNFNLDDLHSLLLGLSSNFFK